MEEQDTLESLSEQDLTIITRAMQQIMSYAERVVNNPTAEDQKCTTKMHLTQQST